MHGGARRGFSVRLKGTSVRCGLFESVLGFVSFFLSFSISLLFFFLCHVFLPSYQSSLCLPLVILSFFFALLCPSVNLSLSLSVFLHLFLFIFSIHPSTSSTVLPSSLLSFVLDFLLSLPPSYQSICLCQFLPSFNSSFLSSLFTLFWSFLITCQLLCHQIFWRTSESEHNQKTEDWSMNIKGFF